MTELPDEAIEAFFVGDAHEAWEQDEALMRLLDDVLIGATGPAPRPGPALLAFLEEPSAAATTPRTATPPAAPPWQARTIAAGATPTDRGQNVVPLFRRLRLTVGIAAAGGVAAAGLAVVGTTAGVLPKPVMQVVSWAVGAVTPFELHEPAKTLSGGDHVPQQGPTSTGRPGPLGPVVGSDPVVGPGPAGQSGAPGRPAVSTPATPPASIAAGVPGAVRPPGTSVDPGPPTSAGPPAPPVPAPPVPASAVSPPAGGGTPSTNPPTWVDRARQAPVDGTVPSTVAGPSARRP